MKRTEMRRAVNRDTCTCNTDDKHPLHEKS